MSLIVESVHFQHEYPTDKGSYEDHFSASVKLALIYNDSFFFFYFFICYTNPLVYYLISGLEDRIYQLSNTSKSLTVAYIRQRQMTAAGKYGFNPANLYFRRNLYECHDFIP